MDATVGEIHAHPLRPVGFQEPLFLGRAEKKRIAEHLRESSSWLRRAGEARADRPQAAREPCHVLARPDGSAYLVRAGRPPAGGSGGSRRTRKRRVARVVERWREVRDWWAPGERTDRLCFRVMLDGGEAGGGAVVDLALDRCGSWSLVRIHD